uniref:G patch domain-containing protein 11 n=1 Tax=Erigeron canadensis TaxID=72917 RepID=UPI001CB8C3EE|nr:G patch domain-containing protein 11 [Erigeron canadensis]
MANEEDDDYMGDLSQFLPSQFPSSPKKVPSTSSSSSKTTTKLQSSKKRPKNRNWQEKRKKKQQMEQVKEDERTLASLESAIPQSNIGFKMLKQMGYTPGSGLGDGGSGQVDPVGLEIRRSRAGIGREDPVKEKLRKEEELSWENRRREEELMLEFGSRVKERWKSKRVVVNFYKAKGVLDQLENKEVVEVEKNDFDDGQKEDEEEEEEVITEEDLLEILMKLRDDFRYCLFCGCQYESMEALSVSCPGIYEDDH